MMPHVARVKDSGTLEIMEIDKEQWPKFRALASFAVRGAPKAVVVALSSIIIDEEVADVWPYMDTTASSTTWTCWILTETSLGHIRIEYNNYLYDQNTEFENELTPSAWSAWVRPLATVTGIRLGAFYAIERNAAIFRASRSHHAHLRRWRYQHSRGWPPG
jgi:hypothetical protein